MVQLQSRIQAIDNSFSFEGDTVFYDGREYGRLEILIPGFSRFEKEVDKLRSSILKFGVHFKTNKPVEYLQESLSGSSAIVVMHAILPVKHDDQIRMFEAIDPIWEWLMNIRGGILNVDEGGFSNKTGTIL